MRGNNESYFSKKKTGGVIMLEKLRNKKGFTLVELLIVVIILSVLAAVIIPQFGSSTADAKLATLDATMAEMRNAIERYYHDHTAVYPGAKDSTDGTDAADAAECISSFTKQLTQYTTGAGVAATVKSATAKYGPYIKKGVLPTNPFNDLNTVGCDITEDDVTVAASDGTKGWKIYTITGRFLPDDGAHDSN
jgi:prepilin-type N-terminal cleavage/methylation domain-containing protein